MDDVVVVVVVIAVDGICVLVATTATGPGNAGFGARLRASCPNVALLVTKPGCTYCCCEGIGLTAAIC